MKPIKNPLLSKQLRQYMLNIMKELRTENEIMLDKMKSEARKLK
jgi:hypothetical protein